MVKLKLKSNNTLYQVNLSDDYQRLYKEGMKMYEDNWLTINIGLERGIEEREDYLVLKMLPKRLDRIRGNNISALINYFVWRNKNLEDILKNLEWKPKL